MQLFKTHSVFTLTVTCNKFRFVMRGTGTRYISKVYVDETPYCIILVISVEK